MTKITSGPVNLKSPKLLAFEARIAELEEKLKELEAELAANEGRKLEKHQRAELR